MKRVFSKNFGWLLSLGLLVLAIIIFLTWVLIFVPRTKFAFPGAEGFGAFASGGRGGAVYHVTSLSDNENKGSLRYAVNKSGARIIVFDVSGVIDLKSPLIIKNNDITIAGQSAPGVGICIKGQPVIIDADNVIIRYLRFRLGDSVDGNSISVQNHQNIMIDHCSISWATKHNIQMLNNVRATMQWCIISEALNNTKFGVNGSGAKLGGLTTSFHHNLFINNTKDNPYFNDLKTDSESVIQFVDFRNNVIINWQDSSSSGLIRGAFNLVNNYYKYGRATKLPVRSQIINLLVSNKYVETYTGRKVLYAGGNYVFNNPINTNDNSMGIYPNRNYILTGKNELLRWRQFPHFPVNIHPINICYKKVLNYAGASKYRDDVDKRLIEEVMTGKDTQNKGIINSPSEAGGYGYKEIKINKADTDGDGMPDNWELKHGLNPEVGVDAKNINFADKDYTNIELYLNDLVSDVTHAQSTLHKPTRDMFWLAMLNLVNMIKQD